MLKAANLSKYYGRNGIKAVDEVSFGLEKNATLGLVGESGSGKSTLAKMLLRLIVPTSGEIYFEGQNLLSKNEEQLKAFRKEAQMVFQNPFASLNPSQRIIDILEEPFLVHGSKGSSEELLEMVKLHRRALYLFPHELSGGQRQRINIARAIALRPKLLILDEPLSALDISIQAEIANLLLNLQKELKLTYLFISHDLNMVRHFTTEVAVMYRGKIVEMGETEEIFTNPRHPYTKALLASALIF